jgi:hypothetical protein
MKRRHLAALLLASLPACADVTAHCSGITFSEARSLSGLPKEVVTLLAGDGRNAIADSGEKFNVTDVIRPGYENAPFRRFNLAAVSSTRIFAAVEHGGRGYSVELWSFERGSDGWRSKARDVIYKTPATLAELVGRVCK